MNNPYYTAPSFEDLDSLSLVEIRRKFDELRAYTIELATHNEELRQSEEKHRTLFETMSQGDAVARSESKYRELFELNQDAITIFRIEPDRTAGKFLDMNQAALKLGGYSKKEYRDLRPSDFEKDESEVKLPEGN